MLLRAALNAADIQVFVCDCADPKSIAAVENMIQEFSASASRKAPAVMVIINKIDSIESFVFIKNRLMELTSFKNMTATFHNISCRTNAGLDELEKALEKSVNALIYGAEQEADESILDRLTGITRQRHRHHVEQCVEHLKQFLGVGSGEFLADNMLPLDARAEELRYIRTLLIEYFFIKLLKSDWGLLSLEK